MERQGVWINVCSVKSEESTFQLEGASQTSPLLVHLRPVDVFVCMFVWHVPRPIILVSLY